MHLPTLLALASLSTLTAATPSRALLQGSCGKCDTYPSGGMGGNAQIPLRLADKANGKGYKCTNFGDEVRLSTCFNADCGLCVFFKSVDCPGDVLLWSGPGSEFGGQGARSYFCM